MDKRSHSSIAPDAPQSPTSHVNDTGAIPYQIEPKIDYESKLNAQAQEINNLKYAVHALRAVLISGDKEKENSYEMHKIPIIASSKIVE